VRVRCQSGRVSLISDAANSSRWRNVRQKSPFLEKWLAVDRYAHQHKVVTDLENVCRTAPPTQIHALVQCTHRMRVNSNVDWIHLELPILVAHTKWAHVVRVMHSSAVARCSLRRDIDWHDAPCPTTVPVSSARHEYQRFDTCSFLGQATPSSLQITSTSSCAR